MMTSDALPLSDYQRKDKIKIRFTFKLKHIRSKIIEKTLHAKTFFIILYYVIL